MAGRKLKDQLKSLSLTSATEAREEPSINVPPADVAGELAKVAEDGFKAIRELHADRNRVVEMLQEMHQENVYLRNVNNGLRQELQRARYERDRGQRLIAHTSALAANARDLNVRIDNMFRQEMLALDTIEPMPGPTNNPDLPALDTTGLPQQFDENGIPDQSSFDDGPPPVDAGELKRLAERLNGSAASSGPALQVQRG